MASKFPALTQDNDWILGRVVDGDNAILLDVKTAIQEWYKDCFFNMDAGIDYNTILANGNTISIFEQQIRNVVSVRPGVVEIIQLTVRKEGRNIITNLTFKTIFNSELNLALENG